jgi:hypothetical protein
LLAGLLVLSPALAQAQAQPQAQPQAQVVELQLEKVTATTGTGVVELRLGGRATFSFDPGAGLLLAAGTWIAEYPLPNRLTRIAHKVEDLRATADGKLAMKSYECVEGAFGAAFLNANICGNYRFGPNGIDEGGLEDDEVLGPPKSLARWGISDFGWDGQVLVLTLAPGSETGSEIFPESALELRLVPKPPPPLVPAQPQPRAPTSSR